MSVTAPPKLMTTEDLLAMPDDGIERWIIDGRLHEKHPEIIGGVPMTVRNRTHSRVLALTTTELICWLRSQPEPRGQVLAGEAGVRLGGDPETTVGIDLVYISAELVLRQTDETTLIDGVPTLAVEILSPSDTIDDINEKIYAYQKFKVP